MQKFAVQIVNGARQVAAQNLQQLQIDLAHGLMGAGLGIKIKNKLRAVIKRGSARSQTARLKTGQGRDRLHYTLLLQEAAHRRQFLIITAQREHPGHAEELFAIRQALFLQYQTQYNLAVAVTQMQLLAA